MVDILASGLSPLGGEAEILSPLEPAPSILADKIDPETGEYESLFEGRDPVDAQVLIAVSIARGTGAAVLATGNRFRDAKFVSERDKNVITSEARRALSGLLDRGDIEILEMSVLSRDEFDGAPGIDDYLELTIVYLNLRANGDRRRTISTKVALI